MRYVFLLVACATLTSTAFAQDAGEVELTAPASAVATADGSITITTPDVEAPPEESAGDAADPVAENAPADATPEAIVIPVVDPVDDPSTGDEVVAAAQGVKDAWYSKNYPAIAGAIIFLLLTLFRLPLFGSLTRKIPARYRVLVAVGLSFAAAFLQIIAMGTPWDVALVNVLGTSSAAVFANELIVESVLGKRYQKS